MEYLMKKESGFTLIEMIATLVLVGILAAIAGMGIVTSVQGYLFAKENATIAQKAQLTIQRIAEEVKYIANVTLANPTSIVYAYDHGGGVIGSRAIGWVSDEIKIIDGTTLPDTDTGDVLVNAVNSFTLGYVDNSGDEWVVVDPITELSYITIDLVFNRNDGLTQQFSTAVGPRRTGGPTGP